MERAIKHRLLETLRRFPAVALVGPRQVGKTTLALEVARDFAADAIYVDLERDSDRARLREAESYLTKHNDKLVVLDEIHRLPDLFPLLRSLIDERIRNGRPHGQFLLLGSASRDVLNRSSESLAGRIAYFELDPFNASEVLRETPGASLDRLWMRGGFPRSYLAPDDDASWEWRTHFVATFLERDLAVLGFRLTVETMRRLWSMLAHTQSGQLNAAALASSLGVSGGTVRNYLDILSEMFMVRLLPPWSGNSRKRLVKSPKVYVRDSGLLHRLAGIPDLETLLGHPLCGPSFEGFVIQEILGVADDRWRSSYYRTSAQAEIDLVLEGPKNEVIAVEIKRNLSPIPSRGFLSGCEEIGATRRIYVVPEGERHMIGHDIESLAVSEAVSHFREILGR